MTVLLVALGAGVGAAVRFATARRLDGRGFARGTWLVNVVGSALLGLLVGSGAGADVLALLGVGFCGGLTTYSSFAVQTHDRGRAGGTTYAVLTLGAALAACALGFVVGSALG